jgi:hypothetical protein
MLGVDNNWYLATSFTYSAATSTPSTSTVLQTAFATVDAVRQMADDKNVPYPGTLLADVVYPRQVATCADYSTTLEILLGDMNIPFTFRTLNLAFNANTYDVHTLVEMYNPDQQSWILLDPTFDLTATRASDGGWATAEDISSATVAKNWNQINYVFLGSKGDYYARNYYLDYPLLYLNVYHQGTVPVLGQGASVLPYYQRVSIPAIGAGFYAIRCTSQPTVTFVDTVNNGVNYSIDCTGVDSFSYIFSAQSVAIPDGGTAFELYIPIRYVF